MTTTDNPSKALIIAGINEIVLVPDTAYQHRDEVLAKAKEVRAVFDDASRDQAIAAARELKEARLQLGKFKDFAKAPVTALGKKIESEMAAFSKDIGCGTGDANKGPEEKRIEALLVRHENQLRQQGEDEDRKRAAQAEADRQAEINRLAEIKRREDEAARLAQQAREAAEKAARARSDGGREKAAQAEADALAAAAAAQDEADRLSLEAEQADLERRQREQEDADRQTALAVPIAGMKAKEVFDFEVINPVAFAMQFPQLCEITVKRRETLEAMNEGKFDVSPAEGETLVGDGWEQCKVRENVYRQAAGLKFFKATKIAIK